MTGLFRWIAGRFGKKKSNSIPSADIPSVDTGEMVRVLRFFMSELEAYLAADPDAFRRIMLNQSFFQRQVPEYGSKYQEILYLLKMSWVYSFEYFCVLRLALSTLAERGVTSVAQYSFGCGSCLDALSLSYALRTDHQGTMHVYYTGVDSTRWETMFPLPQELEEEKRERLIVCDIRDFWNGRETFDGNILFFPKILSELDELTDTAGAFARGLSEAKLTQERIMLCVSYRGRSTFQRSSSEPEWDKTQKIIEALQAQGYTCDAQPVRIPAGMSSFLRTDLVEADWGERYPYYYLEREQEPFLLKAAAPDFAVPEDIWEYLSEPGIVRRHCRRFASREQKYLRMHPEQKQGEAKPVRICEETCNYRCGTLPQVAVSTPFRTACFQVLLFTRK